MRKYGLNYSKSLGVTIVNLRELAKDYSKDHLLAHKLWTKGYRESKILASLLDEPQKVDQQQINRWLDEMDSNELIEQVCMNLFVFLPQIEMLIPEWLQSGNYRKVLSAIIVIGHLSLKKQLVTSNRLSEFVEYFPKNIDEFYLRNQVKRSLGKMVRLNDEISNRIVMRVSDLKSKDENWKEVWDDLQYELNL
jgi:3-methyladenine DNA glycosylase AlkD